MVNFKAPVIYTKGVMTMFMGQYNHTIDTKGRVIIPSKFRDKLGGTFVVTKGLDECLYGYSQEDWDELAQKIAALPITNPASRKFTRFFVGSAAECEFDKQGRILIPASLREYAGLSKDVVLVGAAGKIEIWSKDKYEDGTSSYEDNMDEVVASMEELGFLI